MQDINGPAHIQALSAPPRRRRSRVDVESVRAASDDRERASLLATDRRALFTAEVPEGTEVRPGEKIRLALDPSRFHFFDPATGATLRPGALAATA